MKTINFLLLIFMLVCFTACDNQDHVVEPTPSEFIFNFETGAQGWEAGFADYTTAVQNGIDFESEYTTLPEPLNTSEGAIKLAGKNVSDDLFMFIKKQLTGLEANTTYEFDIEVTFATNVADNMVGIGGSPGESVFVKAGATEVEPEKIFRSSEDDYRMNIDKGNQSQGGSDMQVIGDFSNDTDENIYTLKTVSTQTPAIVTTDASGSAWVIVGTDSGFEGETVIYYDRIVVTETDNR